MKASFRDYIAALSNNDELLEITKPVDLRDVSTGQLGDFGVAQGSWPESGDLSIDTPPGCQQRSVVDPRGLVTYRRFVVRCDRSAHAGATRFCWRYMM